MSRTERPKLGPLATAELICLIAGGALAFLGAVARLMPERLLGWLQLQPGIAIAGLAGAAALGLSFFASNDKAQKLTKLLAVMLATPVLTQVAVSLVGWRGVALVLGEPMPAAVASAVAFLALVLFFIRAQSGPAAGIADASVLGLSWTVLTLLAEELFQAMHVFDMAYPKKAEPAAVWMLMLLGLAALARRMGCGTLSIFLGPATSSRITRNLAPLVVILPFFREVLRARLIASGRVPEHSATAAMASTAALVSVCILLAIGYAFRRLENEVRDLSLRDELTSVYNLRGFRLLAEQALRLAQRSHQPFSVMFVDVDELKLINDELGHAVGSSLLAETANLLQSSFRETDVVGRIGGDEFAIAGQFDSAAIARAAERVAALASYGEDRRLLRPGLSIGHVTAEPGQNESLEDLLGKADAAMYEQKRRKKQQVAV